MRKGSEMGTRIDGEADWIRNNQGRYLADGAPQGAVDAVQHVLAARAALMVGEVEVARFMYESAGSLWRSMDAVEPGEWSAEIRNTLGEMQLLREAVRV